MVAGKNAGRGTPGTSTEERGERRHVRTAVVIFTRSRDRARWGETIGGRRGMTGAIARRLIGGLTTQRRTQHGNPIGSNPPGESGLGGVDVVVFHDGEAGEAEFIRASGQYLQRGNTFGERLTDAVGRMLSRGYDRVVVVGTDTPHLRTGHVMAAVRRLEGRGGLVLGQDTTGGCYLIGVTRETSGLLEGVCWQAGTDFATLAQRGGEGTWVLGVKLADVDDAAQLHSLDLAGISRRLACLLRRLVVAVGEGLEQKFPRWTEDPGLMMEVMGLPRCSRGPPGLGHIPLVAGL